MTPEHDAAFLRLAFMEASDEMGRLFEGRPGILSRHWKPSAEDIALREIWTHFYICVKDERGGEEIVRMLAWRDGEIERLTKDNERLLQQLHAGVKPAYCLEVRA